MILRLSDSLSRGLLVVASLLVAIGLSFFGVRSGVAQVASEETFLNKLQLAVKLEPGNPEYWYRLGHFQQFNLEQQDVPGALDSFQKALALNPGYTDAWLDLGTSYELEGNMDAAREAYLHARRSYPASAEVAWRYGNYLLRAGDLSGSFVELRKALLADPRRAGAAFSRIYRADPDIDQIVNQVLPPEPSVFVDAILEAVDAKQLGAAQSLWLRLIALHPRLKIADFDRLVRALIGSGDYEAARRVWDEGVETMDLPPLLQARGSLVWDSSFESGINGNAFAWTFRSLNEGVQTAFDSTEKLTGRQSLRLTFDGKHNPNLDVACTDVVVTPGRNYLFSGWIKAKEITTEEGVGFRLHAVSKSLLAPITTRDVHGTTPWTLVEQPWTAGPDVHMLQICVNREPSDNPDVRISGTVWVDDVVLVPQPAGHVKP
jgi:tetratricopeptide (TPR) repeat protein